MENLNILIAHVSYQASAGSFIKLLRNSNKYHFYIVGCDSIEMGYSSGSVLVDKFYHVTEDNPDAYINTIQQIVREEKINVIISAEEDDLNKFRDFEINEALYTYIPPRKVFNTFRDKQFATTEIETYGISTPKSIINYSEFQATKIKKIIRRDKISCCSRGITILDRNDITKHFKFHSKDYFSQEFIDGDLYTVDVFCDKNGIPCSIIPRKDIAIKDGTTFKCIIDKQNELINICKKIYSIYFIPGFSNVQFIMSDRFYFIELNPRVAATMIASAIASVNYMDLYISHFLFGNELPLFEEIMNNVKWGSIISRYYNETIFIPGDN